MIAVIIVDVYNTLLQLANGLSNWNDIYCACTCVNA